MATDLPDMPPPSVDDKRAHASALRWLHDATLRDARAFALGEERRYVVDQDQGTLELRHARGVKLTLSVQLLGSFRPQDRSFRWAWANSGVAAETSRAARYARDARSRDEAFATPTFHATFDQCTALVALAGQLGDCDGVYRAITAEHLTVFLGYQRPMSLPKKLEVVPDDASEQRALKLSERYDAAMLPFDVAASEAPDKLAGLRDAVAGKRTVHGQFWHTTSDEWRPGSVAWPSPHDPAEQWSRFALPRRAGGTYVITLGAHRRDAHVVEDVAGEPRITDIDLGWGKGLLFGTVGS